MSLCTCEIVFMELSHRMRHMVVPAFWGKQEVDTQYVECLKQATEPYSAQIVTMQYELMQKFIYAVADMKSSSKELYDILVEFKKENCQSCSNNYDESAFVEMMRAVLLSQQPSWFKYIIYAYCWCSMRLLGHFYKTEGPTLADVDMEATQNLCYGCNILIENCACHTLVSDVSTVNDILINFKLLDRLAGHTITALVQKQIDKHVRQTCTCIFDRSHLQDLESWLNTVIISWLTRTYNQGSLTIDEQNTEIVQLIQNFKLKLTYFLYEIVARNLINQFFSIIIDYPDSIPAVDDLKVCLEKIDLRHLLVDTLKTNLENRILHPGVNTKDILTGYIAAIKTIRHLDSSGLVLASVTAPIKDYLRKRNDTVRRVVTGLTEDGPTDLSEELAKADTFRPAFNPNDPNCEANCWENWYPDPLSFEYTKSQPSLSVSRSADIITMMIDIYGSNELFMNEYRNLMADRLLTNLDFSPQKEIRNLELLKIRFGEALLHSCEVMLKDVADSKRINTHIQSDTSYTDNAKFDISSLIISAQFWPPFNKEVLQLPEEIENEFKKYTKSYEAYKGNRTLNWRHVTGRVNIELELEDRTVNMTVTPTQAVIIYHFQERTEWTLEDLSNEMKVPTTILRRRISFWQGQGLITESEPGVYKLMESQKFEQNVLPATNEEEDELESAMASASDQREEELQVFWSYIVGMLTNLDSLPLERIHQMLKLFASQGSGAEFTQDELKNFLQRKVREHKLVFSCGVYQLPK